MSAGNRAVAHCTSALKQIIVGIPKAGDDGFYAASHSEKCRSWTISSLLGLFFWLAATPLEIHLLPDVVGLIFLLKAGIFLPLIVMTVIVLHYQPPIWLRDTMIIMTVITAPLLLMVLLRTSQSAEVKYMPFWFILGPIFPNVITRLRFSLAVRINGVLLLLFALAPIGIPAIPDHAWAMSFMLTMTVACCTLAASYQLEQAERQSYRSLMKEQKRRQALVEHNQTLSRLSLIDHLTGLANRRAFDRRLADDWACTQNQGQPLTVLMLDIDYFKRLNDRHGHHEGDRVLTLVGAILQNHLRPDDLAARYGGEEFAILLPNTGFDEARIIAERIRTAVEIARLPNEATARRIVTISIGIATNDWTRTDRLTPAALIKIADEALYDAKALGRNRVEPRPDHTMIIPAVDESTHYFCDDSGRNRAGGGRN